MSPPLRCDVAVVGAGIVGSWIALELSTRGARVVVMDPRPGGGSSSGNAGLLALSYCRPVVSRAALADALRSAFSRHPAVSLRRPLSASTLRWLAALAATGRRPPDVERMARLHTMAVQSLDRYAELADRDGLDLGLRRDGWLWLHTSARSLDAAARSAGELAPIGIAADVLDARQAAEAQPGVGPRVAGALFYPDDASLDPAAATEAVLDAARRSGAEVLTEPALAIDQTPRRAGTIRGTASRVEAAEVVLAAGAQTAGIARLLGVRVPVVAGHGWSLTLPTPQPLVARPLSHADRHVVVTPLPGRVRITGGMEFGGRADDPPALRSVQALRDAATEILPGLGALGPGSVWRGARPMTTSGMPVVERLDGFDNVTVAAGHGTLGVTLAPSSATAVADLLVGEPAR